MPCHILLRLKLNQTRIFESNELNCWSKHNEVKGFNQANFFLPNALVSASSNTGVISRSNILFQFNAQL